MKWVLLVISVVFFSCSPKQLPTERYNQYSYEFESEFAADTLKIFIRNPLHSPLRVLLHREADSLADQLVMLKSITLNAKSDTSLVVLNVTDFKHKIKISSLLGSLEKKILPIELDLPFQEGKEFKVIQGNNSNFTHNKDYSRYALDFDMQTNDTICSSTDGFVVGVVDRYKYSGKGKEWTPFANFITIYEPISGVFCQYVHLVENGSLVSIGDRVERGQKIALSGNTGRSTVEHLHLNLLVPADNSNGFKSIPITFTGGIKSVTLKKGDRLKR